MIPMIEEQKIIITKNKKEKCEGLGGALGHPLVYLKLDHTHQAECPYCGVIFKHADHATS